MSAVGSGSAAANNTLGNSTNSLAGISQTEFLQLLLTQLQNQNPLDPMSDTDFATQLAELSEVGSLDSVNTSVSDLLQVQQLSSGESLIGSKVSYTTSSSSGTFQGAVSGLTVQSDGTVDLTVNGNNVPISQVNSVN